MRLYIVILLLIIIFPFTNNYRGTCNQESDGNWVPTLIDSTHGAIDITSQGDYTFIIGSDFRLYKWNATNNLFESFNGPLASGVPVDLNTVTVTELGIMWACARNYLDLYKYDGTNWTLFYTFGTTLCYYVKIGYGPSSRLVIAQEGITSPPYTYYYLNSSNAIVSASNSNECFAFNVDMNGISYFFNQLFRTYKLHWS